MIILLLFLLNTPQLAEENRYKSEFTFDIHLSSYIRLSDGTSAHYY